MNIPKVRNLQTQNHQCFFRWFRGKFFYRWALYLMNYRPPKIEIQKSDSSRRVLSRDHSWSKDLRCHYIIILTLPSTIMVQWKMGSSNIVSFHRVIFHWTMIMGERVKHPNFHQHFEPSPCIQRNFPRSDLKVATLEGWIIHALKRHNHNDGS